MNILGVSLQGGNGGWLLSESLGRAMDNAPLSSECVLVLVADDQGSPEACQHPDEVCKANGQTLS